MTKAELIAEIAKTCDFTKADAQNALNALIEISKKTLKKDARLAIAGFGSFVVTKRKARAGRNPQTGEAIKIKATKVIKFKAGKALKEKL